MSLFWPQGFWPSGFWPNNFWQGAPVPGFRLYVDGSLAAAIDPDLRTFDWTSLGLADGVYKLELTRLHSCDRESTAAVYVLRVGDGGTSGVQELARPSSLRAWAVADGFVALRFLVVVRTSFTDAGTAAAAAYEIAEASDTGTILGTLSSLAGQVAFSAELGPFPHGSIVDLVVRASDGLPGGIRGPWVAFPRVVADAEGPVRPDALDVEHECA